ncbi:MAG TPA: hypothetical protein VEK38_01185 [Candidatus Bathyarchaeia archaeon]|nr:hypothetical protein [Candidatus Bathyarchaeia archaeon]
MIGTYAQGMVYDNRFIPLIAPLRLEPDGVPSALWINALFGSASIAFNERQEEAPLLEIEGAFDLGQLANAIVVTGKPNPLPSPFQGIRIPYRVDGRLQMQGFNCTYYQKLTKHWSAGFSWLFMGVNTRPIFTLLKKDMTLFFDSGDILELEQARGEAFTEIGITQNRVSQKGFGDVDLYVRYGWTGDHMAKMRFMDIGLTAGMVVPSGVRMLNNAPSSVPFGGDGFWGVYGAVDGTFELKEDLKVGIFGRIMKRFSRVHLERASVVGEPYIFGAAVVPIRRDPGFTIIFSPWIAMEHLHRGLGLGVYYTLTSHQQDFIEDARQHPTFPLDLAEERGRSAWGTDYVTLQLFYDFGKIKMQRSFDPLLSVRWDIPAQFFVCNRVAKTQRVAVSIALTF